MFILLSISVTGPMLSSLCAFKAKPLGSGFIPLHFGYKNHGGAFCILSRVGFHLLAPLNFSASKSYFPWFISIKMTIYWISAAIISAQHTAAIIHRAFFRKNGCAARHKTDNVGQHDRKYGHIESRRGKLAEQLWTDRCALPF